MMKPENVMKAKALRWHKRLGALLMLPLLWTVLTGMGFTLFKEVLGNKALGKTLLHLHTLEIIGLEKVYPFILGLSILATLLSAAILMYRKKA
jgi:hypothetical protein